MVIWKIWWGKDSFFGHVIFGESCQSRYYTKYNMSHSVCLCTNIMKFTQKMCPTEAYLPAKFQEHRCKSTIGRPLGEIIAHAHLDVKMSEAGLTSGSLAARLIIEILVMANMKIWLNCSFLVRATVRFWLYCSFLVIAILIMVPLKMSKSRKNIFLL